MIGLKTEILRNLLNSPEVVEKLNKAACWKEVFDILEEYSKKRSVKIKNVLFFPI